MPESSSVVQCLIDRLRDSDPVARNELIQRSQDRLRLLTHQMLAGFPGVHVWEDTSDVFQLALIRLCDALNDPAVRERLATPRDLFRLAATQIRRQLIDLARSLYGPYGVGTNQLAPGQKDGVHDQLATPGDDPYRLLAWQELHQCIAERLTDGERELWELLYYQGLSQPEAAELLNVSLRTLKRDWQQVRIRLRKTLGDVWPL